MNGAVDGDEAQDDLVAQRLAAQREVDLVPRRWELARGRDGRIDREPRVAAQAAVPARSVDGARDKRILGGELARVDADQLVARQPADEQLVVKARPEAARLDQVDTGKRRALLHARSFPRRNRRGYGLVCARRDNAVKAASQSPPISVAICSTSRRVTGTAKSAAATAIPMTAPAATSLG